MRHAALLLGSLLLLQGPQPTFRSGVELVQIDAVVTDKDDRPAAASTAGSGRTISRSQQAAVNGSLSLNGLSPGSYTLGIEARLMSGSAARRSVAFDVK